jgi:hypothetical protein
MPAHRPFARRSSNPIARAVIRWFESAAPLVPGAGRYAARVDEGAALACCGAAAAAEPATRHRRIDSWIAK